MEYFSISMSQMTCGTFLYKQIICRETEFVTVSSCTLCVTLRAYCMDGNNSAPMVVERIH